MKRKYLLEFELWNYHNPQEEIQENHIIFLENYAENHILELYYEGITEGEIELDLDEIEYKGRWKFQKI